LRRFELLKFWVVPGTRERVGEKGVRETDAVGKEKREDPPVSFPSWRSFSCEKKCLPCLEKVWYPRCVHSPVMGIHIIITTAILIHSSPLMIKRKDGASIMKISPWNEIRCAREISLPG
jgi:hypothetical protein